jgi:hypothetical protein
MGQPLTINGKELTERQSAWLRKLVYGELRHAENRAASIRDVAHILGDVEACVPEEPRLEALK